MEDLNDPNTIERWQVAVEAARKFLGDDPMTAYLRLLELERDLGRVLSRAQEPNAELEQLALYVSALAREAQRASERWQAENVRREQRFQERERPIILQ